MDRQIDANKFIKTGERRRRVGHNTRQRPPPRRRTAFDLRAGDKLPRLSSDRKLRVVRACAVTIAGDEERQKTANNMLAGTRIIGLISDRQECTLTRPIC